MFYVQGKTQGLNTCIFTYHIQICEILTPIQGQETYFEFIFNLKEGDNAYMYEDFYAFFNGSSNETEACFFQNHIVEESDGDGGFIPFPRPYILTYMEEL